MKSIVERLLIKILKYLKTDLLGHAHVQIGAGHNTYFSGEKYVIETVIADALNRGPEIIFDVGANIGEYARSLQTNFLKARIFCFEPGPETFQKLIANTDSQNIHYYNVAVGSSNGTLTLFKSSDDSEGAMMTAYKDTISDIFTFAGEISESVVCDMICLDDFCSVANISMIDFLKIDVEGHELEVLKGAARMISEDRINILQFEFNEFNIISRSFMYDYYKLLPQFQFYRIMPQNKLYPMGDYNSSLEIFRYQNILAVNKRLEYHL